MNPSGVPATTFAVQSNESLTTGLKRIVLEQTALAYWQLSSANEDTDTAVHEARKALKKTRAMLRLLRGCLGEKVYRAANVTLRDAGRELSELRIAAVLEQTLADVVAHQPQAFPDMALPTLRQHLQEHHQRLLHDQAEEGDLLPRQAEMIAQSRALIAQTPCEAKGFSAIHVGLERTYRRGRKELAATRQDPAPHHFHLWRKRVKYLRYQMRVLNLLWPALMQAYTNELVTLSNYLGVQHDLIDLHTYLTSLEEPTLQTEIAAFMPALDAYRGELEEDALRLGAFIYVERPAAFTRRLEQYWRVGRRSEV